METAITERLQTAFSPTFLNVSCTDPHSAKFKVVVVSDAFADKSLLQRHRAVNAAVGMKSADVQAQIHALEIEAHTPAEFSASRRD